MAYTKERASVEEEDCSPAQGGVGRPKARKQHLWRELKVLRAWMRYLDKLKANDDVEVLKAGALIVHLAEAIARLEQAERRLMAEKDTSNGISSSLDQGLRDVGLGEEE